MAQWLHVAGVVRIESRNTEPPYLGKVFDHTSDDDSQDDDPSQFTPMGSEGALTYDVAVERVSDTYSVFRLSFSGALRDMGAQYGHTIIEWLNAHLDHEDIIQGVIETVDTRSHGEYREISQYSYRCREANWVLTGYLINDQ